jgi:hypothetical protein
MIVCRIAFAVVLRLTPTFEAAAQGTPRDLEPLRNTLEFQGKRIFA